MKRTIKYALSAVLTAAMVVPALAQDNFPDVPDNHWAFEALARLKKDGLLVGYPDGFYRGLRPASRYELAVAIHACYVNLKNVTDGLDTRIKAIEDAMKNQPGGLDELKAAVEALKADVAAMKNNAQDIADLKKMAETFEKELSSLGVDVQAMKKDLSDLAERVGVLEKRKLPIAVSGDVNALVLSGYSTSNRFGITVDGRPTGFGRTPGYLGKTVGASRDLTVLHEGAFRVEGTNESGPKWHATFAMGNMVGNGRGLGGGGGVVGGAFFNQSQIAPGTPFSEDVEQAYVQDFSVKFDTGIMSLPFSAEIGRLGYMVDSLLYKRPDTTPYFANDRWDNGEWMTDGAIVGFKFGKNASLNVWGGRNSSQGLTTGGLLQPLNAGATAVAFAGAGTARPIGFNPNTLMINNNLGVHFNVPLGPNGGLNLAYIWLQADNTQLVVGPGAGKIVNGVVVYGGDVNWKFGNIGIDGSYGKSDVKYNNSRVLSSNNTAYYVNAKYDSARWGVKAGYRRIEDFYGAPGDWGRIGIWWNPTDIKGGMVDAHFNLTNSLSLHGAGEFYTGVDKAGSASLTTDDKLNRFLVDLGYNLNSMTDLSLGYEQVMWNLKGNTGKPLERWINVGFGFHLSDSTKLSLLWQISDYDGKGQVGFSPFAANPAGNRATGGLITTQISVKF